MSPIPEDARMWYYQDNRVNRGPVSLEELSRLYADNKINSATLVFKEGMEDWVALKDCTIQTASSRKGAGPSRARDILYRSFTWWKILLAFSILMFIVSAVAAVFTKTDTTRIFDNLQRDVSEFDKMRDMIRK